MTGVVLMTGHLPDCTIESNKMKTFRAYITNEFKRFFSKRTSILVLMLIIFALAFLQSGILRYQESLNRKLIFQEIESSKLDKYISYSQYGGYGFRLLFVPAPFSIFASNSGVITDMESSIDTSERLKIYNPLKGKNVFELRESLLTDFSGIVLFFGSLLSLFYGYTTFNNIEYSRLLASITSRSKVFWFLLASRLFILGSLLLIFFGLSLLLVFLNGIVIPFDSHLLAFILIILLTNLFFLTLGTVFSTLKSKITAAIILLSAWFALIFLLPAIIDTYTGGKANFMPHIYNLEMEKLKIISQFEKSAIKKAGLFTRKSLEENQQGEIEIMESFWENGFQRIQEREENLKKETMKVISNHQILSVIFPSTCYIAINSELGSQGYQNYINFYNHAQDVKINFYRFYLDKKFHKKGIKDGEKKIEPFLKKDGNVFYGQTKLPGPYLLGFGLTLFYIIILAHISQVRFRKALYPRPDAENKDLDNPTLKLTNGETRVFLVEDERFRNQLYTLLAGRNKFYNLSGYHDRIYIEERDAVSDPDKANFLYLCSPRELPGDVITEDLIRFLASSLRLPSAQIKELINELPPEAKGKKIGTLGKQTKGEILMAVLNMKPRQVYLIDDISRGMPINFAVRLKEKMEELRSSGALVIYLTTDDLLLVKYVKKNQSFYETTSWSELVDRYRGLKQ